MMPRPRRNLFDRLRQVRRVVGPVEAAQVHRFGRSVLSIVSHTRVLLLHSTGRRSRIERTTTLAVHANSDGSLLVVGGAGGQTQTPDWVANIRATPTAAVTLDRDRFEVRAEELRGVERATAWTELMRLWPQIAAYERRAGREVPVFRLTRT